VREDPRYKVVFHQWSEGSQESGMRGVELEGEEGTNPVSTSEGENTVYKACCIKVEGIFTRGEKKPQRNTGNCRWELKVQKGKSKG